MKYYRAIDSVVIANFGSKVLRSFLSQDQGFHQGLIFSRRVTGFHSWVKLFELNVFIG